MAENPGHRSTASATPSNGLQTPSKGFQSLPSCMKRVKVERRFIIGHLCDSSVFESNSKARSWLLENPGHKPCPTLWFEDNADAGEDEDAEVGEDQEDSDADEDDVEGTAERAEAKEGENTVEEAGKENTAKSWAKENVDEKDGKTEVDQEQEGFDADSDEVDTDAEGNQKKKKLKVKKAAGVKVVKGRANASGDDIDSSRTRSCTLTRKNAPPCMRRKEKKEEGRRLSGFLHTCDSNWFPSWMAARLWLEQNEDHLSFSTSMGISGKEDKICSGKEAIKQKEVQVAWAKKVEDQTKTNSKQSASGVGLLAALQAAMEDEIRSSQIDVSGTKSPDMFDSEEENGKASQGDKSDVASKAGNDEKENAGEKTSPTAGNPSKVVIKKKKGKEEESSSSDFDSDTEGFTGAEKANISTEAKKVVNGDVKKRKTEQTSSSGSESESESEEENSSKVTGPKSSAQATKASTNNKSPIAVSPSKGGEKATEKKDEDSSCSESESETEARPTTKTTEPKSASTAAKKLPQGFSAPRLESFKKAGLPSPGSTATTSGSKGPSSDTSVYDSPKTVESAQVQERGSGSSGSSDDESSEEEMRKRKVAGIKKVKEAKAQSSSSESESDSSDNEDGTSKGEKPVASKTSSTLSKLTEAQGAKKPAEKVVNADGNRKENEAVKIGKGVQKKEQNQKENVSAVKISLAKSSDNKSQDTSPAKTSLDLGNKKKANTQEGKEKGEPPEKLAKVIENDPSSQSNKKEGNVRQQVEEKAGNQEVKEKKSQLDENLAEDPKLKKGVEAEKKVEKETASSSVKKTDLSSEKKSPQLSLTLVPRNNPVEKLKIQEMDCSPILKKVKDAFGSYFEKTMMDGEEMGTKKEKTESGTQEGKDESVKKKKKNKKQKKPEAGFL